jgi:hypothetical protein
MSQQNSQQKKLGGFDMVTEQKPLKTITDKRLAYLVGLENFYKGEGYTTKLNGRENLLEVYPAGYVVPKTNEEMIIEKWID